ncbi:GntR family transcriptional regulator [Streptomyces sp. NPDC002698]|uniref:GntR family transcriptional regulator n=1 Tax=Streptomyces sp. NPDC002698 TaxID=3364660 RepID=UPI0036BB517B
MPYRAPEGKGYADVAAHFRTLIKSGELAPGDALPSVSEIREQFGVASKTVSRALSVLKSEGLVTSRGALGTVVAETPTVITGVDRLSRMERNGLRYAPGETSSGHQVLRRSVYDSAVCEALKIEPGDEAVIRIRVFRKNDKPESIGISIYPPHTVAAVPELADDVRMVKQFKELYTERTGREVTTGQRIAYARQATTDELTALEIDAAPHSAVAVLVTTVTFHDDDQALGYWEDIYAPGTHLPIS